MFNPQCPDCNYSLVLLTNRGKYKCSLCSKLFPQMEIEHKDFREWNKRQKEVDFEDYKKERQKEIIQSKMIKSGLKELFLGPVKFRIKEHRKGYYLKNRKQIRLGQKEAYLKNRESILEREANYYEQHKAEIKLKLNLRNIKMREIINQRKSELRKENADWFKSKERLKNYRRKQKLLALQYLENDEYKPYINDLVDSVSTISLSYLLRFS